LLSCAASKDLLDIDVRALCQDRSGALWIGTDGYGLYRARGSTLDHFTVTNGMVSDIVWAILEDAEGALWSGGDSGLQRFCHGEFHRFTRREGLPYDDVNQILEDDSGNLWISSDYGIYRVSKLALDDVAQGRKAAVSAIAYAAADGLPSVETNGRKSQPAGCKTQDGRLWFPTTRGVVAFDPRNLPDNPHPPRSIIEQIRADGQIIFHTGPPLADAETEPRDAPSRQAERFATLDRELQLPPGSVHVLEIQYSANTFIEADKLRFQYRLDGLDKDWIAAGTRRFAHYANLKPGHYRFRVFAVSKYGVSSAAATSFAFYIQPHFYQRTAFYALGLSVVALAGFGFYRWRLRYLRQIHRLQQQRALAEDRARIARDLHDGLGGSLSQLTLLAAQTEALLANRQIAAHGLRRLSTTAQETARHLKEIIWLNHPGNDSLDGLVSRICQYAEDSLQVAGIRCQFDVAAELPEVVLAPQVRHHLYFAAREILHNAARHAQARQISVAADATHGTFTLSIEDDGQGFTPGAVTTKGHGLNNIEHRIRAIEGSLHFDSQLGKGTRCIIQFPLSNSRNDAAP
jgi:signal transduction histidine kinase